VLVDVRPAQQREPLVLLVVGQREGGISVQLDVVAVEDEGFAGGALALLAAVHEHDALLGGRSEDRLLLVNLDLDAHRLEPDEMLVRHSCAPATRTTLAGPAGRPGPDGRSRRRTPRARRRSSGSAARSGSAPRACGAGDP